MEFLQKEKRLCISTQRSLDSRGSEPFEFCPLLPFPAGEAVTVDIPILQTRTLISTYTHYRPYELRLLIFPQPLGGALKNQNAAPASPPCFRRRRTGCGTQHPLRLACVSLAAAPTTPRCFRRWRRSSSLQSAPLLFESCPAQPRFCKRCSGRQSFLGRHSYRLETAG